MSTVLALVGSARPWGNSEVLAREALAGALDAGADQIALLRLTDLRLEACTGCLACAIAGRPCPLDDDFDFLAEQAARADAIVVAAPTYFLGPNATVKLILDRLLILGSAPESAHARSKPAVALTVAGLESWRGAAVPFNNALAIGLGGKLLGWMRCQATGPGEVLLQPETLQRARSLGARLMPGEPEAPLAEVCPNCGSDFFRFEGPKAVCPICGQTGTWSADSEAIRIEFDPTPPSRWSREGLYEHVQDWVIPSGARFMSRRREVKAGRVRYENLPVEWMRPS